MLTRIAADGRLACVPFSAVVWASFLLRPRIWLHSLPTDIQSMAAPKTPAERRLTGWLGSLVLINTWDLVGIDLPYAYWVNPNRPPIPGTAGARGYKDFRFHARAFLKASVFGLVLINPAAVVIAAVPVAP